MEKKQFTRSVSIIGVGQTKYGDSGSDAELKGMSLQDMATTACVAAMEDAGVNPRQIGKLVLGMVCGPTYNSTTLANANGLLEFLGMQGKAASYHNEVCGTAICCFNEAVEAVASGKCDIAMCVDTDSVRYCNHPMMPSSYRFPSNEYDKLYGGDCWAGVGSGNDTAYIRWSGAYFAQSDAPARHYIKNAGITEEEYDDALIGMSITARQHGSMNPKAFLRTPWEDVAKERGFASAQEYLKSKYNPKYTEYLRPSFSGLMDEGATAIIVCATEIADQFRQTPIEIVCTSTCDMSDLHPACECQEVDQAAKQLWEMVDIKPEEIEYLQCTDMDFADCLYAAEAVGYLPKGEGWKYCRDGLTRFDSVKPMNTDGGHNVYGHAFSATTMATYVEPVLQMRGQAGERQIANPPKLSMHRATGGYHTTSIYIFRTVEGVENKQKPAEPQFKPLPYVKMFYDGLDQGKFLGMKCPECGCVEFPLYPVCNHCGHIGNEIIELSGDVTVKEVYKLMSVYTPREMKPYAPLFVCEAQLAEGTEFTGLIFGITPENYEEMKNSVPFAAKLTIMPDPQEFGYNSFAISYNGAVPVRKCKGVAENTAAEVLVRGNVEALND